MRLSWNEIRARAATFAAEWADARYEKGETQSFYNELFEVFGMKRRRVASFEEPVKLLGNKRGFIDLFWKGVLLVEQKSAGRNLVPAKTQALAYFPGLKEVELPRYILLSDFQTFELRRRGRLFRRGRANGKPALLSRSGPRRRMLVSDAPCPVA